MSKYGVLFILTGVAITVVILLLVRRSRATPLLAQASRALEDKTQGETDIAVLVGKAYEQYGGRSDELLANFIKRYPESLHPMRVLLASSLANKGRYDEATEQCRMYLRRVRDSGALAQLGTTTIIREGASRAFLLVTSAYTEAGARSYSKRVLQYALSHDLSPGMKAHIQEEVKDIGAELAKDDFLALDKKWEGFFSGGENAKELYDLCLAKSLPLLARRVDLMETNYRFAKSDYLHDVRSELFLLVREQDSAQGKATYVLY